MTPVGLVWSQIEGEAEGQELHPGVGPARDAGDGRRHRVHRRHQGADQREVGAVHRQLLHEDHCDGPRRARPRDAITVTTPGGKGKSKTDFTVT